MANYIQQSDLETYLDVTLTADGAAQFAAMLPRMQALIDQYCNRSWNLTNPITENFDALKNGDPPMLEDTFFPKYHIDPTPFNNSFPQSGGINSITVGAVNGLDGIPLDLTYVYSYGTHVKFWSWTLMTNFFNPFGYKAVQVVYNSDDSTCPPPIQQALVEWIAQKIQDSGDANKQAIMVQTDTVKAQFVQDKVGGIPNFVRVVLDLYRLPSLDHF